MTVMQSKCSRIEQACGLTWHGKHGVLAAPPPGVLQHLVLACQHPTPCPCQALSCGRSSFPHGQACRGMGRGAGISRRSGKMPPAMHISYTLIGKPQYVHILVRSHLHVDVYLHLCVTVHEPTTRHVQPTLRSMSG